MNTRKLCVQDSQKMSSWQILRPSKGLVNVPDVCAIINSLRNLNRPLLMMVWANNHVLSQSLNVCLLRSSIHVFYHGFRFCTLAMESHWNDEASVNTFYLFIYSISTDITDMQTIVDLPPNFEALVELVFKNHLWE